MDDLPPLPEPVLLVECEQSFVSGFIIGQMHAYARDAIAAAAPAIRAAERERIIPVVWGHCGSDNDAQRIVDAIRAMKDPD